MATPPLEQHRPFIQSIHRGLTLDAFFEASDRALRGLLRFDSSCWLSLDPATLLPTSHFTREIGSDHLMELAANEFLEDDVNKFVDLARQASPVGVLSRATDGDLRRSARYVRVLARHGIRTAMSSGRCSSMAKPPGDALRSTDVMGRSATRMLAWLRA